MYSCTTRSVALFQLCLQGSAVKVMPSPIDPPSGFTMYTGAGRPRRLASATRAWNASASTSDWSGSAHCAGRYLPSCRGESGGSRARRRVTRRAKTALRQQCSMIGKRLIIWDVWQPSVGSVSARVSMSQMIVALSGFVDVFQPTAAMARPIGSASFRWCTRLARKTLG